MRARDERKLSPRSKFRLQAFRVTRRTAPRKRGTPNEMPWASGAVSECAPWTTTSQRGNTVRV